MRDCAEWKIVSFSLQVSYEVRVVHGVPAKGLTMIPVSPSSNGSRSTMCGCHLNSGTCGVVHEFRRMTVVQVSTHVSATRCKFFLNQVWERDLDVGESLFR